MATRVNTRFVVMLTAVLTVACAGVVGAFYFLVYHTGADLARMGDKQMAEGHYKESDPLKCEPFAALLVGPFLDAIAADPG